MHFCSNFLCTLSSLSTEEKVYNKCLPMSKLYKQFIQAGYLGKSKAITRDKIDMK